MGKDDDGEGPLDDEMLNQIVQQLQSEEEASRTGALASVASFDLWLAHHPALRQMVPVESFAQIGPAILRFLRAMLGLDRGQQDAPDAEPDTGPGMPGQ